MDATQLVDLANKHLGIYGGVTLQTPESPERFYTTEVVADFNGHPVRIEFTESDSNPREYRFNATVYDGETGEQITTGNGGSDWDDAFSIVQWQKLAPYWS